MRVSPVSFKSLMLFPAPKFSRGNNKPKLPIDEFLKVAFENNKDLQEMLKNIQGLW